MKYIGPNIFKERANIAFRKALELLPVDYHPSPHFEVEVDLGAQLGSGYTLQELPEGKLKVSPIRLEEWYELNPYHLLGFSSQEEYFKKIDNQLHNFDEENIVEVSGKLRELCGLKALRKLADAYESVWKKYFPNETTAPFAYSRDPLFIELNFGVDFSVDSPNFKNVSRKGISFPPSTLLEAFYPGILIGYGIPSSLKTTKDYYKFVGRLVGDIGCKFDIYQKKNPHLLAESMAHGLIHYKLTTESPPYKETGKLSFTEGSIISSEELEEKRKQIQNILQRTKDLDCDILIESAARAIAPAAMCRSLERERYSRLELADKVVTNTSSLVQKIPTILSFAWHNDRNAVDLLQEAA